MASTKDLLDGFNRPAAVIGADGEMSCANDAFEAAGPPLARLAQVEPGGRLETPGDWIWSVRALPDSERLILGEPSAMQGLNARERYLAALSHELRTPLNGVLGMAGLLAGTPLDADQRTYVQALKETGAHLLGLVNDVLDLAKLESGQIDLEPAPVDIELLLQGVCELLSPRAHEKGLDIAWAAVDAPSEVLADEGRLRQILFNLTGNAIKFTQTGGVLLQVRCSARDESHAQLRFCVTDTGPGVPEAEQARIFEEYARAPGDTARLEGAGLGLAIVRRLAAAHGGAIGLTAPEQGGAQFWFEARFPLAGQAARGRPLEGLAVQIVSLSDTVRSAAVRQLEACGARAFASEVYEPAPGVEVMLVDRPLAGQAPEGPPALVLLTAEERAEIKGLRARGFAGYLIKPLRRASLAERVLAVVAGTAAAGSGAGSRSRPVEDERLSPACAVGVRVLMAEDNPINALLARTLLEREGCVVDCAANGLDAVQAGRLGAYDLILMDQRMPGMDGVQAARALRDAGVKTPIVALTADAFEDDRRACLNAGMNDFLAKPLEVGALRAALSRWTRARPFTPGEAKDKLAS
jgi:signal transduction histidine kinase/CheY-like chemotaxis protein